MWSKFLGIVCLNGENSVVCACNKIFMCFNMPVWHAQSQTVVNIYTVVINVAFLFFAPTSLQHDKCLFKLLNCVGMALFFTRTTQIH